VVEFHNSDASKKTTWLPICFAPDALLMLVCQSCDNVCFEAAWTDPSLLVIDVVYIMSPLIAGKSIQALIV
jgi:hypothetical protein